MKNSGIGFKIIFTCVVIICILSIANYAMTEYQDFKDGCQPTGDQRMVNSVINAPEGSFSGLVAEDKFVCKDGRITWKAKYQ